MSEQEKDLDDRAYRNLQELEAYSENTQSSLIYLLLECLGEKSERLSHLTLQETYLNLFICQGLRTCTRTTQQVTSAKLKESRRV